MKYIRQARERGLTEIDWLKSFHSFSFGEYRDPRHMGFGPLRVINDDIVKAGAGFHTHGHANMEIITYVLSGALEHKDSLGSGDVIRAGEVQVMSAGKGILHSEFNPSPDEDVHLLQIWIMPRATGTRPSYQQKRFAPESFENRLNLIVSPDGAEGSLPILQDARLYATRLSAGAAVQMPLDAGRKYWLHVARGAVMVDGNGLAAEDNILAAGDNILAAGDALALADESGVLTVKAPESAEILLFDLPR